MEVHKDHSAPKWSFNKCGADQLRRHSLMRDQKRLPGGEDVKPCIGAVMKSCSTGMEKPDQVHPLPNGPLTAMESTLS